MTDRNDPGTAEVAEAKVEVAEAKVEAKEAEVKVAEAEVKVAEAEVEAVRAESDKKAEASKAVRVEPEKAEKVEKEAASLKRWAGGNEQYCEARKWWLENTQCSEKKLQQYLIKHFGYIAESGNEAERAHKIAVCLCQSEPRQSASVDTISLVVSLFALVISVCAGQFINYPQIARWALLIAIIAILLFMIVWVVLKTVIDHRLDRDTEFRGRLSAL